MLGPGFSPAQRSHWARSNTRHRCERKRRRRKSRSHKPRAEEEGEEEGPGITGAWLGSLGAWLGSLWASLLFLFVASPRPPLR